MDLQADNDLPVPRRTRNEVLLRRRRLILHSAVSFCAPVVNPGRPQLQSFVLHPRLSAQLTDAC